MIELLFALKKKLDIKNKMQSKYKDLEKGKEKARVYATVENRTFSESIIYNLLKEIAAAALNHMNFAKRINHC